MYKKSSKKSVLSFVLCFVLTMSLLSSMVFAGTVQAADGSQIIRLSGQDRYKTSVAIAKHGWEKSKYVVIARGDDFADALSAGPLAKKYDAPVLLTETKNISSDVIDEIKSLEVENVIIVGGEGAISPAVANELKALKINDKAVVVDRIDGIDRFATAVNVAKKIGTSTEIALATGYDYPDALSIAPIASSKGMPILLTEKNSLPKVVKDYIESNKDNITSTYIIGGNGVIDPAIEESTVNPVRLGGIDRYETNVAVMAKFIDEIDFENLYMAVGDGTTNTEFADALSGAALAAKTTSPVVLMYKTIPARTQTFLALAASEKAKVIALGGTAVVPEEAAQSLVEALKTPVIASNLGSTGEAGTEKDFQVATLAKDAKDEMVRVKVTVTEGSDIASLSYKEVNDGKYYALSLDKDGTAWYGPEGGFPLSDITSDFKVAFNKTGTIAYKLELVKVSDNTVLTGFAGSIEVSSLSLTGDDAKAYVEPTNFNTHFNVNNSLDYVGYNAGWKLTDKVKLSDVAKMEVSLLDAKDNVLVTNTSTDKILTLNTNEFSTPFNINFHIKYTDQYWTFGKWTGKTQQPAKVQIKVTTKYGDTFTVVNDSLAVVAGHEAIAGYLGE